MTRYRSCQFVYVALGLAVGVVIVGADDNVEAGKITFHVPTLHAVGMEWAITGDDNRNAVVELSYRKVGAPRFSNAHPMLRIGGETTGTDLYWNRYETSHHFAGSIFGLEPDTDYEVRFIMRDLDGGNRNKLKQTRTKPIPRALDGGADLHVYPKYVKQLKQEPSFASFQDAYDKAEPGDRVLIHAGKYVGSYFLAKGGTAEMPIIIQGAGDGAAVFVGDQSKQMFNLYRADYIWFENLTFQTPGTGDGFHTRDGVVLMAGDSKRGFSPGCKGLVVRRCRFEDFGVGIMAADAGCRDFVIVDNHFHGRQDWRAPKQNKEFDYTSHSGGAVIISGQGHDIGHNYIENVRDGVSVTNGRAQRGFDPEARNIAIDIYNNDVANVANDFIGVHEGDKNIRILHNRGTNSQTAGITVSPVFGGPVYIIENLIYNVAREWPLQFKFFPTGVCVYHNTFVSGWNNLSGWSNCHFRNNLFLGSLRAATFTDYSTMDYNGYMRGEFIFMKPRLGWDNKREQRLTAHTFSDLAAFVDATGYESNGVSIHYAVFDKKMEKSWAKLKTYDPEEIDYTLMEGSVAVDSGVSLTNINDNYVGRGPDLGALELGKDAPRFGPRLEK